MSLRETFVHWADQRIHQLLSAPGMWGSLEAVEMQALLLLEMRALAHRPEQELEEPRRVIEAYFEFLREKYPLKSEPLSALVHDEGTFTSLLGEFVARLEATMLAESPFERSDLAIQLTFQQGTRPTISAFTGYYEDFRRATRAAVQEGTKPARRPKKDIERATDFVLEDAVVTEPNGAPGKVLLRLGRPAGQGDWQAEGRVRDALSSIVTLAEWAGSDAGVSDLAIDTVEQRTRTALQAVRLVPRRGIQAVELGGKLVARSRPVELVAGHEKRFLQVVGDRAPVDSFDESDEIRAIDLDRGWIGLGRGRPRLKCYARSEVLTAIGEVGVRARVIGQRYRPANGQSFVFADTIEILDDAGVAAE